MVIPAFFLHCSVMANYKRCQPYHSATITATITATATATLEKEKKKGPTEQPESAQSCLDLQTSAEKLPNVFRACTVLFALRVGALPRTWSLKSLFQVYYRMQITVAQIKVGRSWKWRIAFQVVESRVSFSFLWVSHSLCATEVHFT
jgi:hypothetical protein